MRRLTISLLAIGLITAYLTVHWVHTRSSAVSLPRHAATGLTLPLKADSVRFAVIGDNGTAEAPEYQVAEQMQKMQQLTKFTFVIMLGDNLYGGASEKDYESKFARPYKALLDQGVMFYAALGNHDDHNEISYAPFHMGGNRYFTHVEKNVEFFVLDSNYMDGAQLDWVQNELQKSTSDWKIAFFHHPLYSSGKEHGSDTDLRSVLEPLFEKYGVNVVLSGHEHMYERINPQNGINYFVVGNSGKLKTADIKTDTMKASGFDSDQSFMLVEIAGDELYFNTVSRTGEIVDSGVLHGKAQTKSR